MSRFVSRLAACMLLPSCALAHSPYLLPNTFDLADRDHVSVQASFTETFFVPDVVMKSGAWTVRTPDGRDQPLTAVYTRDLAVLDVDTPTAGTYRISSGLRDGRTARAALVGEDWKFLRDGDAPPAGARVYEVKSITSAEVYVSRGTPTDAALAPRGHGLEFQMLTHPNKVLAGTAVRLKVLFDGQTLAGPIAITRATEDGDAAPPITVIAGADGLTTVTLAAGRYHAMRRHRVVLPGTEARAESHTYALTLEVAE
ncbi:MAG TPA: DUF4198 domain-containing protein [Steroidobacteraceae bacterium]|nr:DUF4198 domain-containing protein [Steroidobacteraceae bacterium]